MTTTTLPWQYDDGGRAAAKFRGETYDCVCRAIAIGTELPYRTVYDGMRAIGLDPRMGVYRQDYERWLTDIGWTWTPTKFVGQRGAVHLRPGELPDEPRIICRLSKHLTTVIDGVIRDTHDPSRGGERTVYGYYLPANPTTENPT